MTWQDWTAPVDAYCERTSPDFWAEPFNAWTNLAFILAGASLLRMSRKLTTPTRGESAICGVLIILIGLGSFSFHTFANRLTGLLDVLFIAVFVHVYLVLYLRRAWKWTVMAVVLGLSAMIGLEFVAFTFPRRLGLPRMLVGAMGYMPALLAMLVVGGVSTWRKTPAGGWLLAAAGVFSVSLTARSLDHSLCNYIPIGTHFLWHLLNALVLWMASLALVWRDRWRA